MDKYSFTLKIIEIAREINYNQLIKVIAHFQFSTNNIFFKFKRVSDMNWIRSQDLIDCLEDLIVSKKIIKKGDCYSVHNVNNLEMQNEYFLNLIIKKYKTKNKKTSSEELFYLLDLFSYELGDIILFNLKRENLSLILD